MVHSARPAKRELKFFKELKDFIDNPPLGCSAGPTDESDYKWEATIVGPPDSLYASAIFKLAIEFPANYPFRAPTVTFTSPVYHPNVSTDGSICLEILSGKWTPAVTISKVLLCIGVLLQTPNFSSPLNREASNLFRQDPVAYALKVREISPVHSAN